MALEGAAGAGAGAGGGAAMPRTVDEIFRDYKGRWAAMIKALTSEVEEFYKQCDPEKENLCLYGYPEEIWEVNLPAEEIPPELPEPALGINFAREGMEQRDWLSLVAVHSDAWLLAVASFFSARLEKPDRKRLFLMIMELPTIFEVVSGRKTAKEKTSASNGPPSKPKSSGKVNKSFTKPVPEPKEEESYEEEEEDEDADADADADEDEDDEEEEEQGETFCGSCGGLYKGDGFWIGCDVCEKWFHGKCVKITPAKAEHIKKYKCPSCNTNKRA